MTFIDSVKAKAAASPRIVILPEGGDPRIRRAAEIIAEEGFAHPVIFGNEPQRGAVQVINPDKLDLVPLVDAIQRNRPKTTREEALHRLQNPMTIAAGLVATGLADAMVAGAATPTPDVMRAGLLAIGLAPDIRVASTFFVMLLPNREPLFLADCALNISPDAATLADIAVSSSLTAASLSGQPARTALLSYSTYLSGAGVGVDLVHDAVSIVRRKHPELMIDGPLQADAALNMSIAVAKGAAGEVGGQANTLIFPTLDAGNIGYKLLLELAGGQAVGPILQGLAKPMCDLSKVATVEDIVAATAITMAMDS